MTDRTYAPCPPFERIPDDAPCDPATGEHGIRAWWHTNGRWALIPELADMFVREPVLELHRRITNRK